MSYFRIASCNSGSSCLEGKISSLETWNTQEANVNKALNALDVVYQEALLQIVWARNQRRGIAVMSQYWEAIERSEPSESKDTWIMWITWIIHLNSHQIFVGVITTPHCHLHWWGLHTEGSEVFADLVRHPAGSPQGEKNVLSSRSQHQNAAEWSSDLFMPWTENDASLAILFTSVWVFGVGLPM